MATVSLSQPAAAALSLVGTPGQPQYVSGSMTTFVIPLTVELAPPPTTSSIQFVTGPSLSASPITFSLVPNGSTTGPAPTVVGTTTNAAAGWNPVVAPTPTTFTAFNFTPQSLGGANPSSVLIGQVSFTVSDPTTSGMFDLQASAHALDGVDMPTQAIGTITVIPEPLSGALVVVGGLVFAWMRRR